MTAHRWYEQGAASRLTLRDSTQSRNGWAAEASLMVAREHLPLIEVTEIELTSQEFMHYLVDTLRFVRGEKPRLDYLR
jgi:hypothetical protein